MSEALTNMLSNIEHLSTKEKALAAHCLLVSMNDAPENNVDKEWLALAKSRTESLKSGDVKAVTWEAMKKDILG